VVEKIPVKTRLGVKSTGGNTDLPPATTIDRQSIVNMLSKNNGELTAQEIGEAEKALASMMKQGTEHPVLHTLEAFRNLSKELLKQYSEDTGLADTLPPELLAQQTFAGSQLVNETDVENAVRKIARGKIEKAQADAERQRLSAGLDVRPGKGNKPRPS